MKEERWGRGARKRKPRRLVPRAFLAHDTCTQAAFWKLSAFLFHARTDVDKAVVLEGGKLLVRMVMGKGSKVKEAAGMP